MRNVGEEVRELGPRGVAFRLGWEAWTRLGAPGIWEAEASDGAGAGVAAIALPYAEASEVAAALRGRIPEDALARLRAAADDSARGTIVGFGRSALMIGEPPRWHRDPISGACWPVDVGWSKALGSSPRGVDVKLVWEAGRFPHAYHLMRAAAFFPDESERWGVALWGGVRHFLEANPVRRGVHWASGQEVTFRIMAWLFSLPLLRIGAVEPGLGDSVITEATHVAANHVKVSIAYAQGAVHNNHLLSEALLLLVAGSLKTGYRADASLVERGKGILDREADGQFYADGGYIQLSHNYHRLAMQDLIWAVIFHRAAGGETPRCWFAALERSVDFLFAHQNPSDGRLPNYGANDGALPGIFSTCDFSDFRPTLQVASLLCRGERLYGPGPWDEEAAWLLGPGSLHLPSRKRPRTSVSFAETGFHVLRSATDEGTFATFRCGSVRDRFSQIDMLNLDLFWKGQNVLVDGGSYLYNGPAEWHDHFVETASHNTVVVDGLDQMLHYRKFKCLYWTEAELLAFERKGPVAIAAGRHFGYRRHPGGCVHQRSVAFHDSGIGLVVDTVTGSGVHSARLQWLAGDFPHRFDGGAGRLVLETPAGEFTLLVAGRDGRPVAADVAEGQEVPPRGWLSRYYGEKVPVPSLATSMRGPLPLTFLSAFGPGVIELRVNREEIEVQAGGDLLRTHLHPDGQLLAA